MHEELIKALKTKNTAEAQRLITEMDISEVINNNKTILELTFHNGLYSVYETFIDKLTTIIINEINDEDIQAMSVDMAKYTKNLICEMQNISDDTDKNIKATFVDMAKCSENLICKIQDIIDDTDEDIQAMFVDMVKCNENLICKIQDVSDDTDILGDNSSDDSSFE